MAVVPSGFATVSKWKLISDWGSLFLRNNVPDAYRPPSHGYQKKKSLRAKNRRIRLQDFSGSESRLFGIQTKIQ